MQQAALKEERVALNTTRTKALEDVKSQIYRLRDRQEKTLVIIYMSLILSSG
jgi:hypothetical protein